MPQFAWELLTRPASIRNQVLFVVFGFALAFSYATVRTNIETAYWTWRLTSSSFVWSTQAITNVDLKRAQNAEVIKNLRDWYAYISGRIQEVPGPLWPWVGVAYLNHWAHLGGAAFGVAYYAYGPPFWQSPRPRFQAPAEKMET